VAEENVVLTGFMATGKSSVGRLLAARLGYEWVDTDALIESRYGAIPVIFSRDGESAFRRIEAEIAGELGDRAGLVISTGGRLMLEPENAAVLGDRGRVFCLTAATEEIVRRVEAQDGPDRPLLAGDDPAARIKQLLEERVEAYARFEQVPTDGRTLEDVVDDVVSRLRDES
jgi:shikimate kinase